MNSRAELAWEPPARRLRDAPGTVRCEDDAVGGEQADRARCVAELPRDERTASCGAKGETWRQGSQASARIPATRVEGASTRTAMLATYSFSSSS